MSPIFVRSSFYIHVGRLLKMDMTCEEGNVATRVIMELATTSHHVLKKMVAALTVKNHRLEESARVQVPLSFF